MIIGGMEDEPAAGMFGRRYSGCLNFVIRPKELVLLKQASFIFLFFSIAITLKIKCCIIQSRFSVFVLFIFFSLLYIMTGQVNLH